MDVIKCDLVNTPSNFFGGKISQFLPLWLSLSTENWFYFTLQVYIVNFTEIPVQLSRPRPLQFTTPHQLALDQSMQKFINQGVVERCSESIQGPCFYSNIFPVMKQDGSARIILDLSVLRGPSRFRGGPPLYGTKANETYTLFFLSNEDLKTSFEIFLRFFLNFLLN